MEKIQIGGFVYEQNDKGDWLFKADNSKIFKKGGALRKPYADMPRFKCIIQAEESFMKDYNTSLVDSVKEAAQMLNTFGH